MMNPSEIGDLLFMAARHSFSWGDAEEINKVFEFMEKYAKHISNRDYGCLQRDAAGVLAPKVYQQTDHPHVATTAILRLGGFCREACLKRPAKEWFSLVDQEDALGSHCAEFEAFDFGAEPKLERIEVSQEDILFLATEAFLYAIGRQTYVSSMCEDFAKTHAKELTPENAQSLAALIAERLPKAYTDAERKGFASCDIDSFEKAQKCFEEAAK